MEKKIYGKTDSLRKVTLEYMESFIGECYSPGSFIPVEITQMMQKITGEYGDEVAVCLDRHNRVLAISYGDFRCVSVPELKIRRSDSRLCGIRFLHTHPLKSTSPHGVYPSEVDINTLRKERFDAMAVIGIYEKEILGVTVTVLQRDQNGELSDYETVGPCKLAGLSRFDSLFGQIKSLDKHYSKPTQEVEDSNEKAILVGVIGEKTEGSDEEILAELKELAESAGATVLASYTQRRKAPNAGTYIGAGFAKDLSLKRQALGANLVIFDDELTPTQIRNLEQEIGKIKFLIIYFGSGLFGNILSGLGDILTGDYVVSAGASGAVFGIIGALLYVVIRNRGRLGTISGRRLMLTAGLSLYYGFTSSGVDNLAHVGGLVSGFILGILLYWKRKRKRRSYERN